MACFARKLRYGACDGDSGASFYFALVELARKKGGRPIGFVLYRRTMFFSGNRTEMIRLSADTAEEAVRRFWPSDTKGTVSEFPGHRSEQWKKTTLWLNHVAAGGAHECFGYENHYARGIRLGGWAKVGTPTLRRERRKRRKKKPLQVGNLAHILLKYQALLHNLTEEKYRLGQKLTMVTSHDKGSSYVVDDDDEEEEYYLVSDDIEKVDDEIASVYVDIDLTKEEMRYIVRKMFPKPIGLIPKRVLRYERARKDMGLS